MTRLQTIDFPNFHRTSVGFDNLFDQMERFTTTSATNYPPYNLIELNENEYLISLAVAGFDMDNLDILKEKNVLRIEGRKTTINDNSINYLHQGIAGRNFKKEFTLADNVEVENATLELGMLNIHLVREVPEADQPKKINISTVSTLK
jgi:molecular chaperone IbpA